MGEDDFQAELLDHLAETILRVPRGNVGACTIVHDDIWWVAKMRFHFRKDVRHDSWIGKVGLDIQVSITYRTIFNTASCRCYLIAGAGKFICNEGAGARTNAEDENGGFGSH